MNVTMVTLPEKLCRRSREQFYDVYTYFDWPEQIEQGSRWLTDDCLTVGETPLARGLSETQMDRLSQVETVNLFSIFAHGEASLLETILRYRWSADIEEYGDYLSHFIDEENKHMWFFTEFCHRYHDGMLSVRTFRLPSAFPERVEMLLAFLRIIVFEEIGDYFNVRVSASESIPQIVRDIHHRHHLDESGHIAAGWKIAAKILQLTAEDKHPADVWRAAVQHINSYVQTSLENFYSPEAYRLAGLEEPYALRRSLLASMEVQRKHQKILTRVHRRLSTLWKSHSNAMKAAQQ
jgi:hypothetical protein